MHALAVRHHSAVTAWSIYNFWASEIRTSYHIAFVFVCRSLLGIARALVLLGALTLDVHWRLRSDSVLRRRRSRLLRIVSLLSVHLASSLTSGAHQIVMLLNKPERIWRGPAVAVRAGSLGQKTLRVGARRSFLSGSRP